MAAFTPWTAGLGLFLLGLIGYTQNVEAGMVAFSPAERADGLCQTFVLPYGHYACQEYRVQTEDGFLIGLQRMWRPSYAGPKKGPALLMHGILTGGDVWVINPPDESLGFLMADAGYDVWISNYRSTTYSYGHTQYTRLDKGFWDWSLDEIAFQDLCSSLQLVHSITNQKAYLVAYSEGAQATLASFSRGFNYDMVKKAALLAPVSYITSGPQLVTLASKFHLQKIYQVLNIYELSSRTPGGKELVDLLCRTSSVKCYDDWFRLFSGYLCCINSTRRSYIDKYETQATSVKNLDHFSQQITSGTFAQYNYGKMGNLARYGQMDPPKYDVKQYPTSQVPTLFIRGEKDSLANEADVKHLLSEVPAGFQYRTVPNFGHLDFVFGYNAHQVVYRDVIDFFEDRLN